MGVLLALLLAAAPSASTRREADRLAAQARADRQSGAFKTALDEANRAYRLFPRPAFLFEIAEDQRGLGQWAEAAAAYQRYLATHPGGSSRSLARRHLADAKAQLRRSGGGLDALAVAPLTPAGSPRAAQSAPTANALEPTPLVAPQVTSPPVVEAPAAPSAPSTAVEATATTGTSGEIAQQGPTHRSHLFAYTLIGVSAASLIVAAVGWGNVASYNSYVGGIQAGESGSVALGRQSSANTWQDVAIATTIVTALAGGAVALTW